MPRLSKERVEIFKSKKQEYEKNYRYTQIDKESEKEEEKMNRSQSKLYLAANKRGILLELFFGTEPPKDYNGVYIGTNACRYLNSFPHQWAREHGMELEPGEIAVITDIKYEVIR